MDMPMPGPDEAVDADALAAAAQADFRREDFAAARAGFAALCRLRPGEAHYADRLAHCLSGLADWPAALAAWHAVIALHGVSEWRVNHVARCLIELEDYAAAADFLTAQRDLVPLNRNFLVFGTVAALGAGRGEDARRFAREVVGLAAAQRMPAIAGMVFHLERLARRGWAGAVLALLADLSGFLGERGRWTELGIGGGLARLWETRLRVAGELIRAAPDAADGYLHEVEALLELDRRDAAAARLRALRARFAVAALSEAEALRLELAGERLACWSAWGAALAAAGPAPTFQALKLRAAAHVTLRQYAAAIEVALEAVRALPEAWPFMLLLGRCFEALGDLPAALDWLERAADGEAAPTNCLIELGRLRIKAGLLDAAYGTATELARRYPAMPAVLALFAALEREPPDGASGPPLAPRTWLHGGDSGDVIYALAAMRAGGGGHLYLTSVDNTREPMAEAKIGFLAPLLLAQPYVTGVGAWAGEAIAGDFTIFRQKMLPDVDLASQHWRCVLNGPPEVTARWLTAPDAAAHGRPVFARSPRYRNRNWDGFWGELKAAAPDALFVGSGKEHAEFGHGEHVLAADALALARVIAGASVFVGNQSLPYAIAEGLKVGRLLEVSTFVPNCVFPGALALPLDRAAPAAPARAPEPSPRPVSRSAVAFGWRGRPAGPESIN
jgi:tetratricopeptide (TPR) repeat protein